jgi:hypothetical protein
MLKMTLGLNIPPQAVESLSSPRTSICQAGVQGNFKTLYLLFISLADRHSGPTCFFVCRQKLTRYRAAYKKWHKELYSCAKGARFGAGRLTTCYLIITNFTSSHHSATFRTPLQLAAPIRLIADV